ncbi:MAG: hypothetical protein Q4C64_02295 [Erysipelotrichia bacterium]|nr:hypothetical protein [Erysipelotrichia bacterium]
MIVYIYKLGLLKTGYVQEVSGSDLSGYVLVGDYNLVTIEKDFTQTKKTIKAYIKRATD